MKNQPIYYYSKLYVEPSGVNKIIYQFSWVQLGHAWTNTRLRRQPRVKDLIKVEDPIPDWISGLDSKKGRTKCL